MKIKTILFFIIVFSTVLRLVGLDNYPPSIYSDEAVQGYDAYSILKTGRDEHGTYFPISFRSFGDWKPPVQTYLMIPSIALFGLNAYGVRLPSAICGVGSVVLGFLLVNAIFIDKKYRYKIALLSAFLLSISPWHLHQSRSAMLVMAALFFIQLGIYMFISALIKNKKILFIVSSVSFMVAFYSYYGMRIIVPMMAIFLIVFYFKKLNKRDYLFLSIPAIILMIPLVIGYFQNKDVVFGRAKTVSVFYDRGVKLKLSELQTEDGSLNIRPKVVQFFHNRPYLYFLDILERFTQHLDGKFLFLEGDNASPFKIPNMGVLYLYEIVSIPVGIYLLLRKNAKVFTLLIVWLIVSILPAAFTFMTPSHNRSFSAVLPYIIFSAFGVYSILKINSKLLIYPLILVVILSFNNYLKNYYTELPQNYSYDWLYGFKDVVNYLNKNDKRFTKVVFLPNTGMSYIFILFYNQYDPNKFLSEVSRNSKPDNFGFEHINSFNKYNFYTIQRDWDVLRNTMEKGEVYIGRPEEIYKNYKEEIFFPNGEVAFRIAYVE